MGSSEDNVNKASSIYSKTKDISDIEKIVDKILQDNENKSKAIESKSKTNENLFVSDSNRSQEINAGYFSPEKKKKESIYYLRKKSNENGSESEKNPDDKVKRRMHFGKTKNTIFDESTLKKKEKNRI